MTISIRKILILLLFINFHSIYASELIIFDVGQGNCNLFVPKKGLPILYDSGSTKSPTDYETGKKIPRAKIVSEISQKIKTIIPYDKILNVVISHGDTDHYSYILDIVKTLGMTYKFHFFLGGKEEHYSSDFIKELKKIPEARRLSYYCAENYTAAGAVMPSPEIGEEYTSIFLSKLSTNDKNACSLVLKINKTTVPEFSILLTGDATDDTTAAIPVEGVTDTTILIANHHGSNTWGSSNQDWIDKTKPEITIFSAKESSHEHPSNAVVSRYHESPRLRREAIHEFSYSGDRIGNCSTLVTYHEYQSGVHSHYRALIRKAMFNTMNEGTMLFKLDSVIAIRPDKAFFSTFPMKGLITLDLSAIEMINTELLILVPKLAILKLLQKFHLHSNFLVLTEAGGKGKEAVDVLHEFMKNISTLEELSLWGDHPQEVDDVYVKIVITNAMLHPKLKFTQQAP